MQKINKHGKPGSPFGGLVTQFPETPDETVDLKPDPSPLAKEAPEAAPAEDEKALATVEQKGVAVSKVADLPTVLDFMPESTAHDGTEGCPCGERKQPRLLDGSGDDL